MDADLTIGIVFPLIGGLLIAIGLFLLIRTRMFISKAQEVKGTVIRMVWSGGGSDGGGGYSPVYQFRTIDGQTIVVTDSLSSNPPMFKEGQVIDVLYDPANPQKARIKKWMNLYFASLLLGGLGSVFACVGIVLLFGNLMDALNF